jgi:DNA-binding SARP family transcriptional activator/tetratricopeptide (TPR) repeat protein
VRILLLGPVRAERAGQAVELGPPQHRLLLAVLALEVNRLVPVERLVELIWPVGPPRSAEHAVQVGVSRLRLRLRPAEEAPEEVRLDRQGPGYLLRMDPASVDAHRFTDLVRCAKREDDDERRVAVLDDALRLWTGPAMSGTAAAEETRNRLCRGLEETRLTAVEERIDARLRLGDHRELLGELATLVDEHPLRERLTGQLMLAFYRSGRPGEALAAYRRLQGAVGDDLGLDPGEELRRLEVAILREDPALDAPVVRPAATMERRPEYAPRQLPAAAPGFVGRLPVLTALDKLLNEDPAVPIATIDGTAGVGKTTLAVQWAYGVADRFTDGVLYVNLRGFHPGRAAVDPGVAVRGFLDALGVPAPRMPPGLDAQTALYRSLLAGRRMLIVLDNARDAEQVRPLLPGAPGCFVLVTSRNQLTSLVAVEGAQSLSLDVLGDDEARELLGRRLGVERLAADPETVEEIIARSARLPLALAIVAARAAARPRFPLMAFLTELRDSRHRLDALSGGDPATDIRAVLSWSYRALTDDAASMFRLLGLHPGPEISVAAAGSLAALPVRQAAELLTELAAAHLAAELAPGRYSLHDLLRDYAAEQAEQRCGVAERGDAQRRVLDHYLRTAHAAAFRLDPNRDPITLPAAVSGVTPEQVRDLPAATGWLGAEYPVLLATVDLAVEMDADVHVWQLTWALMDYFNRSGHWHDQAATFETAVRATRRLGDRPAEGYTRRLLARALGRLGRYGEAEEHLRQAIDLFASLGDLVGEAHTHIGLSWILERQGRTGAALRHDQRALGLFEVAEHVVGQARALNNIGWRHAQIGDRDRALAYCRRSLGLCRQIGDTYDEAIALDSIGYVHHTLGDHRRAVVKYHAALRLYRELSHRDGEAETLTHLGDTHHHVGAWEAARQAWREALDILDQLGHPGADQVRAKLDGARAATWTP